MLRHLPQNDKKKVQNDSWLGNDSSTKTLFCNICYVLNLPFANLRQRSCGEMISNRGHKSKNGLFGVWETAILHPGSL
jgi:hypothetical protein